MMKRSFTLLAALVLVMAGCGGGNSDPGVASLQDDQQTTTTAADGASEADAEQAMLDFAECMREHGVDMADPTFDSNGPGGFGLNFGGVPGGPGAADGEADGNFDFEAMSEARDACSQYLEGITRTFDAPDQTATQDTMYQYAQCMRDNGYDMPDPTFSDPQSDGDGGGGGRGGFFGEIDPNDPAFQTAQEACQDILGGFGFGLRPGGGAGAASDGTDGN